MRIKKIGLLVITTTVTLILMFEVIQNASFLFFTLCALMILGIFFMIMQKSIGKIFLTIGLGIISSWIIYYVVYQHQSRVAFEKIKAIHKEQIIGFYSTNNYEFIPESKQYTWIGILPRKIKIIEDNKGDGRKLVGWRGNSVFGYYNIAEDRYSTSIK
ncbi:MAG: hypothetical protein IPO21_21065 [Bacteroidales bacterium]|nr:hypothetical protein [Bacteroidales bacterium]